MAEQFVRWICFFCDETVSVMFDKIHDPGFPCPNCSEKFHFDVIPIGVILVAPPGKNWGMHAKEAVPA